MTTLLLDRKEAATLLRLSVRSIDLMIAEGHLKPTRLGRRVLVSRAELERLAAEGLDGRIRPE